MKKLKPFIFIAVIIFLILFFKNWQTTKENMERGRELSEQYDMLYEKWFAKNNPTHDANGPQPTQDEKDDLIIAASEGKSELPKTKLNKAYSSAEVFFKEDRGNSTLPSLEIFNSTKYNYSIIIPETFQLKQSQREHIDFCFNNGAFSTIVANISQKMTSDAPINDAFLETYEQTLKQMNPNLEFLKSSIINIDNNNVMVSLQRDESNGIWLNSIEYYFYHNDNVYIITASASEETFSEYETIFFKTINSLKFN
jgi:hypothetical protein